MYRSNKNKIFTGANKKKSLYDLDIPENWNQKLIIFIHGYMGYKDWGCWNLVSDYFTFNDFGFLKYNASHNGGTINDPIDFNDLEAFSKNTYIKEIEDLESILNLIRVEIDMFPEIYIIGHSRGGGIALLQGKNEEVRKICSWAGIASLANRFPSGRNLEEWKRNKLYYRENGRTKQQMPHHFSQYESYINNKDRLDIKSYCQNSIIPTLVIHGETDTSVDVKEGRQIAKWLKTDLKVVDGAQHTFGSSQPWEKNVLPEELNTVCKLTLDFFLAQEKPDKNNEDLEKPGVLSEIAKLVKSENDIRDIEFQVLLSMASQAGVTKNEFKSLFEQYIEFNPPKLEADRIIQFQRLILLMNVDLEVDQEEITYIKDLGIRMGLHPAATDEILKQMNNYENKIIPSEKLINIFKTFHN
jgi:pimeloyl-ACP methyl ester carboxylesterase